MSLPVAPLEDPDQLPGLSPDGKPSRSGPKWTREVGVPERNVVPLRLPAAPALAPETPAETPDAILASGIEQLVNEAAMRQLLQCRAPDSQPLVVKPIGDPVGLALGMMARLIVAGCAAAIVALLLTGIIPLPFRFAATDRSEITGVITVPAWSPSAPPEQAAQPAQRAGGDGDARAARAPAPTPGRVATVSVRAATTGMANQGTLDADEVGPLIKRGEDFLAQGDIAAARLILGPAVEAGDPRATYLLAATYDPAVLKERRVLGFRPDLVQARAWYEKAAGYGSGDAARRLGMLPSP